MAGGVGGTVETVLASPRIAPAPATLEEARNAPGRRERIEELTRLIEERDIRYVFFQQVSITGRVMGKGVVSSFFPAVAERGYQLVYGATANLFTDRYGNYIGFGPEESELAAVADLDTFAVLPWDERVARVFCDCYDTETGELGFLGTEADVVAVAVGEEVRGRTVDELVAALGDLREERGDDALAHDPAGDRDLLEVDVADVLLLDQARDLLDALAPPRGAARLLERRGRGRDPGTRQHRLDRAPESSRHRCSFPRPRPPRRHARAGHRLRPVWRASVPIGTRRAMDP